MPLDIRPSGRARFVEAAAFSARPRPGLLAEYEAGDRPRPEAIYPELRAITANKVTRNGTFYPTASLLGDPARPTGIRTALYPYPIPIIRDHASRPTPTRPASPVLGRVLHARFVADAGGGGYVSLVPRITEPDAIRGVLAGELLTVSVGIESESCTCSLCGQDLLALGPGGCGHEKGQLYTVDGQERACYWRVGPVLFQETSFVVVPSDDEAGVLRPDLGVEGLRVLLGESDGEAGTVIDVSDGRRYRAADLWGCARAPLSGPPSPPAAKENPMSDTPLTVGELYGLPPEDPDFGQEAALTGQQRRDLPDADFCGPDRTFPAHDRSHVTFGLQQVGRYAGPGDKAAIRACLLRRGARLASRGESVMCVLRDERTLAECPVLAGRDPEALVRDLAALGLLPADEGAVSARIARLCEAEGAPRPEALAHLAPAPTDEPAVVLVTAENYPILFATLADALERGALLGAALVQEAEDARRARGAGAFAALEAQVGALAAEHAREIAGLNEAHAAALAAVPPPSDPDPALAAARAELAGAGEENAALAAQVEVLREKALAETRRSHRVLAEQAAILLKTLRRPLARGREIPEVAGLLEARSRDSIENTISDLLLEAHLGSFQVDPAGALAPENRIPNPVLLADDAPPAPTSGAFPAPSQLVADPRTGLPTVAGGVTETEEQDSSYVVMGLSARDLQAKIAEQKARMGL